MSPLYAALTARLMQINGIATIQAKFKNGGYYKYLNFNDITLGESDCYTAGTGWDPVTGLGSYTNSTITMGSHTLQLYPWTCSNSNSNSKTNNIFIMFLCLFLSIIFFKLNHEQNMPS